jgi:hypothetical protein
MGWRIVLSKFGVQRFIVGVTESHTDNYVCPRPYGDGAP